MMNERKNEMDVATRISLSDDLLKLAREVQGQEDVSVYFATLLALNANEDFLRDLEDSLRVKATKTLLTRIQDKVSRL
jgi:hypothetical protein